MFICCLFCGKRPTNPILSSFAGCVIFTATKIARTNGETRKYFTGESLL